MQRDDHLALQEIDLVPSGEWSFEPAGWCVIRSSRGFGYGLHSRPAVEIAEGDLLVVPPAQSVIVRASQIGPIQLHYFQFRPELLGSLLTLPEQVQFARLAKSPGREVARLPATHEAAAHFAAICKTAARGYRLGERCEMLALVALLFADEFQKLAEPSLPPFTVRARFEELVASMSETEMLQHTAEDLAGICRCSALHFVRMFRNRFGGSLRSRQIRMRMEHAREMLLESDTSVIEVAAECGYRNRRLFNEDFRRQFGATPSQLREGAVRREAS